MKLMMFLWPPSGKVVDPGFEPCTLTPEPEGRLTKSRVVNVVIKALLTYFMVLLSTFMNVCACACVRECSIPAAAPPAFLAGPSVTCLGPCPGGAFWKLPLLTMADAG